MIDQTEQQHHQNQEMLNYMEEEYTDDMYNNLFYFKEDAPPRPSPELSRILEKRLVPDMKTFEDDLLTIYNIYITTNNITDLRCIRKFINIPTLAGGRSLHIATVHNRYDFEELEVKRYSLFSGFAQWTRFNQLHLDDTLRLNKLQHDIKQMVENTKENSRNLKLMVELYEQKNKALMERCDILEYKLNRYDFLNYCRDVHEILVLIGCIVLVCCITIITVY
jgi:hypothetical protein